MGARHSQNYPQKSCNCGERPKEKFGKMAEERLMQPYIRVKELEKQEQTKQFHNREKEVVSVVKTYDPKSDSEKYTREGTAGDIRTGARASRLLQQHRDYALNNTKRQISHPDNIHNKFYMKPGSTTRYQKLGDREKLLYMDRDRF